MSFSRSLSSRFRLALAALLAFAVALAPAAAQRGDGRLRDVVVDGERRDQQLVLGDRVVITARVDDDIVIAGATVTVQGARGSDILAAAGRFEFRDSAAEDIYVASLETLLLSGRVADDATIFACPFCPGASGRVVIAGAAAVGGDVTVLADTLEIAGSVAGNLRATARRIVISGQVSGRAELRARDIEIAAGASLGGLVARSPAPPRIAGGAAIAVPPEHIPTPVEWPAPPEIRRALVIAAGVIAVAIVVGSLLLAVLVQAVLPAPLEAAATRLRAEPWSSIGLGLAVMLLAPLLAMLLAATVIGVPAAFVLGAAMVVLAALAWVTSGYAAGLWIRARTTRAASLPAGTWARIGWTLLGLVGLKLLALIPIVGWAVVGLLFLAGVGALATGLWRALSTRPAPAGLQGLPPG